MMKPHEMSSVIITGPNSVQEAIIKELHRLQILHISEHSKNELADIGKPMDSAAKISEILIRIKSLISAFSIQKEEIEFELKNGMAEIEPAIKKISEEASSITEELKKAEEQISRNESAKLELEMLKNFSIPLEAFSSYRTLACFSGFVKNNQSASILEEELHEITTKFLLKRGISRKKNFVVLFIDAKRRDEAGHLLQKIGFSPVSFTNISGLKGKASVNLSRIQDENTRLKQKIGDAEKKLEKLGRDYRGFLLASEAFLREQLEKAEAPLKFAATQTSFLIKGWIPSSELRSSIDKLNKAAKGRIFVHFEPAKESKVPVKLKNLKFAKPFEFFIDLYSMPSYREIDPTFFIFLTFPIFFGIMLGDIGYGILSLIVFLILKKKMPKARNFFNILILASFATVLFGILFGEFFGFEIFHPLISREHEMFKLLYISIAIGVIHVNMGLIVGFINEFKSHGFMHAVYAKISWFVLQGGIAVIALAVFGKINFSIFGISLVKSGIFIIILALVMLFIGEGIKGPIESISILTNTMSYARLMAIGLSSVILAVIINDSAREFFHKGGIFIMIGVLILLIGHAINIMLGLLGSFLHSLRLHYVEFFSKFFHGGAQKYKPFGLREE